MSDSRALINKILVELFNDILDVEAAALRNTEFEKLTVTEFHIIEAIGPDEDKTMSETAHLTGVTIGTLTTPINRLIRKGAVTRRRDEQDRRVVKISLTDKGRRAFQHHQAFHEEMTDSIMRMLHPEQNQVLMEALEAIQEFFSQKAKEYGG